MSDSLAAVVAHGLLNSLAVVNGTALTLRRSWDALAPEQRHALTELLAGHSALVCDHAANLPGDASQRLAGHLSVMGGVCETLQQDGRHLRPDDRGNLFDVLTAQVGHATDLLHQVVRGLPMPAQVVLDRLDGDREAGAEATA